MYQPPARARREAKLVLMTKNVSSHFFLLLFNVFPTLFIAFNVKKLQYEIHTMITLIILKENEG